MFDEYDQEFIFEALEMIESAQGVLLNLENASPVFKAQFDEEILRILHTIKGAAGMFGLKDIEKSLHFFEDLYLRESRLNMVSSVLIDYLLRGLDAVKTSLQNKEPLQYNLVNPGHDKALKPLSSTEQVVENKEIKEKKEQNSSNISSDQELNQYKLARLQINAHLSSTQVNIPLIYVVEDDQNIREHVIDLMNTLDFNCKGFENPIEALKEIVVDNPDLIITDISMPEMDGMEFISKIYPIFPHLPVIILSGNITKQHCIEFLGFGAAGILEKPFNSDHLISMARLNVTRYQSYQLLGRSIRFIQYQFSDLENYLINNGLQSVCERLRNEMKEIISLKRNLDKLHK